MNAIDPLAWLDAEAAARASQGLTRVLVPHAAARPGRIVRDGRELLHFGSNDYLGLAADPRLAEAAREAARDFGWGAGASPLVAGWTEAHQRLADDLARFENAEAVALFPSGFAANLGTIAALVGPGDAVYCDRLNHACLIDGVRLSGASLRVYAHGDVRRLASASRRDRGRYRRSLIATDGVFSMDGDLAPLDELVELAESLGAILMVDEAHGTAVFGPDGRGAASAFGVAERVPVRVGTLSKALGSIGGFVAGSRRLIDHLVNHARPLIYSTAPPPAAAAAAREALRISLAEPERRHRVHALADRLRDGLADAGIPIGPSKGPIVPVPLGEADLAIQCARRLADRGIFAPAIRPPTVPAGTSRLRLSVTAAHDEADVDVLIAALAN
ncbi:MAG: 8-amino-7-oxononanoate synthase [Isosphaeraceae bacterium]